MPRLNQSLSRQRLRLVCAWLPRRTICNRAVHHVFRPDCEKEKCDDDGGWIHVRPTTIGNQLCG
jgi:hypothetical protein